MTVLDTHPKSAPHEIRANILYTEHSDKPYWAVRGIANALDHDGSVSTDVGTESWTVSITRQSSGLKPRPSDDVDTLYEYRISCTGEDERKLPILIQPRLDWDDSNRPQSIPDDVGPATNVRVETATYLAPEEIESLIPQLLCALANHANAPWKQNFFTGQPHDYSSITQYERYYRIERETSQSLVSADGIFHRLFELLADSEGSKVVHAADDSHVVGYNHQIRLDRSAATELLDGPQRGKQFKYYHPKRVRTHDIEDPLYHPKIGCLFKKSWNNNDSVQWDNHDELSFELEENLINLLHWDAIPIRCGSPFVSDWHFTAAPSDRDIIVVNDPTPRLSSEQSAVLVSALSELTDRDRDILEAVANASDTGIHVRDIEAEANLSNSTVYRGLDTLDDLLQNRNGIVQFTSRKIRKHVHDVFDATGSTDTQMRLFADAFGSDTQLPQDSEGPLHQWQLEYAASIDREGQNMTIRIQTEMDRLKSTDRPFAPEVIGQGSRAWAESGGNAQDFRDATVEYDNAGETKSILVRSLLRHVR